MDIVGIGLANIDLVAHVDEDFLIRHRLPKGQATRLKDLNFGRLRGELHGFDAVAGGCAANTLCGLAAAGFDTRFYGKIGDDSFESVMRTAFRAYDVTYEVEPAHCESSQCAVLITPDGERTFAYCSGASWELTARDFDFKELWSASLIYAEIYAMAFGQGESVWPFLINTLRESKGPLAVKVVDQEYAELYGDSLFALAEEKVLTLLIGNSDNLPALVRCRNVEEAIEAFRKWSCMVLMTDGKRGAHLINGPAYIRHNVTPIENPLNTSGAGDQFAAGFISGLLNDKPIEECLMLAQKRAEQILMIDSPRPPIVKGVVESIRF